MKSSSIPSIRVEPELRQAAESVLREGESLSSFMEESLKAGIQHRKAQREFIARGLTSRAEAKQTGEYFSADAVFDELKTMLLDAEKKAGS
nr:YlcI/YnfO family protein [uncultured Desulfuromonas sp.]